MNRVEISQDGHSQMVCMPGYIYISSVTHLSCFVDVFSSYLMYLLYIYIYIGYTDCMVGTHADIIITDAYVKGNGATYSYYSYCCLYCLSDV